MNLSAKINPFRYGNSQPIEVAVVKCMGCGKEEKVEYPHENSNTDIKKHCFKNWQVKGVGNCKTTLCPDCKSRKR